MSWTTRTYTLHFRNVGQAASPADFVDDLTHVTDDGDVTVEPGSEDLTVARDGDRISITGEVPAVETFTVTYEVTLRADGERGDDVAANFLLLNDPENPPAPPTDPVCDPADTKRPDCTVTPIGALVATKSVDPASGIHVGEGEILTYTLTFTGTGQAPAVVDHVDHLGDVLDDASWLDEVTVTGDLTVVGPEDDRLHVTGTVGSGETATVTYQVRVFPYADHEGNGRLANFLAPVDDVLVDTCEAGDPLCTSNPMTPPAGPTPPPVRPGPPASGN